MNLAEAILSEKVDEVIDSVNPHSPSNPYTNNLLTEAFPTPLFDTSNPCCSTFSPSISLPYASQSVTIKLISEPLHLAFLP
jgi:hypothetical protein